MASKHERHTTFGFLVQSFKTQFKAKSWTYGQALVLCDEARRERRQLRQRKAVLTLRTLELVSLTTFLNTHIYSPGE